MIAVGCVVLDGYLFLTQEVVILHYNQCPNADSNGPLDSCFQFQRTFSIRFRTYVTPIAREAFILSTLEADIKVEMQKVLVRH